MAARRRADPGRRAWPALMTHFATADELKDDGFFAGQLERVHALGARGQGRPSRGHRPRGQQRRDAARARGSVRHGALRNRDLRHGPVRRDPAARALEPALELSSYVAEVKPCRAGESAGYGRQFVAERRHLYRRAADRLRRRLAARPVQQRRRADRRSPLPAGRHCQHGQHHGRPRSRRATAERLRGERAILIGIQGSERITAEEVARRLDTINYEISCALTPRVPRLYHRDGTAIEAASPAASDLGRRTPSWR